MYYRARIAASISSTSATAPASLAGMTVPADPRSSLTTLLFAVLFLAWICHIGRSQMDQVFDDDVPRAVCEDPVVNSSIPMPNGDIWNCTILELYIVIGWCNGNVTLEADPVAFIHSKSPVLTRVNSSDSNATLHYNLCVFTQNRHHGELIRCTHNDTEAAFDVDWKWPGLTNISVAVFGEMGAFMGCASTVINVAKNSGLQLNVSLQNDPMVPSITPFPFPPNNIDPSVPVDDDVLRSIYDGSSDGKYYLVGNITFICETNHTEGNMYFKYSFGDGYSEPYTNADNITHVYADAGDYNYSVDAIAINKRDSKAFHAAHSGQISVLVPVSGISMKVNGDNKFEVNVDGDVKITALGSRPIIACWYVTTPGSTVYHPVDPDPTHQPTIAPSPIYTCELMNETVLTVRMTFYTVGQFVFVAVFYNHASRAKSTIPFGVVQSPSKAVVASTSTLIAILAILIAVVSLLMIVMFLYIPYRKYKTKFTETANFKFVDLSESTQWDRARMKVREFTDKLNRNRRSSAKVGLVNEQNESSRLMHFPFESVS